MMSLQISPIADHIVNNMIMVSGTERSGTTIVGNLIGTAQGVEYSFEPPTLIALTSIINQCNGNEEKDRLHLLFKAYCYEELLIGAITGRYLNFNKGDDSYIMNIKDEIEIHNRLEGKYRKKDIENTIDKIRLAVKLPNAIMALKSLSISFPTISNVITIRNPNDIINSFLEKKWYNNVSIKSPTVFWPYTILKDYKVPDWVPYEKAEWWLSISEIDKIAYHILINWEFIANLKHKIVVRHEDFVAKPENITSQLFESLNLEPTLKTAQVLKKVKNYEIKHYPDVLSRVEEKMRNRLQELFACI